MTATAIRRWTGLAGMLGGLIWIIFWSLHTLAHGPDNPAPTGHAVWGHTSEEWALLMFRVAAIPLIAGLLGLAHWHGKRLGIVGWAGVVISLLGLLMLLATGLAIGAWILYALGAVVTYGGLILFGLGVVRARVLPRWSGGLLLLMGCLPPVIDRLRQPGSPFLEQSDLIGYLLLESYGAVFGIGWLLLGYTLWTAGNRHTTL
jgi:drug/metabolite transporter (DMT)-like permease